MIKTSEFKKHVAKEFGNEMRLYGFKGTGFEYFKETEDFLFAVYISPGGWGGNCSAGFAVHPKQIKRNSEGKLDLSKLKIYEYEFKMGLTSYASGDWWDYADDKTANLQTLSIIVHQIKAKAFPVFEQFTAKPNLLDLFDARELNTFHKSWTMKTGVSIATTDHRFSWAMTIYLESKNLSKAKEFANWATSDSNSGTQRWFGDRDFRRVLTKTNGA